MSATPKILLYGYGNPGRQDDGLGIRLAEDVQNGNFPGVTVDSNYQLNAEDALTISQYDIVVFADASKHDIEGFRFSIVPPAAEIAFTTHAMAPGSVVALCQQLYDTCPPVYMLEIKGYDWNIAEGLSQKANDNLSQAMAFLTPLIASPSTERFNQATTF